MGFGGLYKRGPGLVHVFGCVAVCVCVSALDTACGREGA